jgi:plastocyanin
MCVVAGLGALVLGLAGCGGSDDESSDATADTTTATAADTTVPETGIVLRGSVGPGFEISLTTEDGEPVTALAAGSYTLLTDDQSDIHNFHLTGEAVDVDTGVAETGTNSFDIEVTSGTYTFVCDPHSSTMSGEFEVTS